MPCRHPGYRSIECTGKSAFVTLFKEVPDIVFASIGQFGCDLAILIFKVEYAANGAISRLPGQHIRMGRVQISAIAFLRNSENESPLLKRHRWRKAFTASVNGGSNICSSAITEALRHYSIVPQGFFATFALMGLDHLIFTMV